MDMQVIERKIKEILEKDESVIAGYLFGSLAKGLETFGGDIDVAVLLKDGDNRFYLKKESEITMKLIDTLNRDDVDLTILNVAAPELAFEVISKGNLLLSINNTKRIRFEEEKMLEYYDLKPFLDEYDRIFRIRIKRGA